ncbi:MAG: hypothetical protein KJ645_01565, partial [Planctomycetes bacterium]|nr:hypothetical protein [Planctomycetota bacterium]
MAKKLLVAWFNFSLSGGIGRFINLAGVLERWGHTVEFVSLINQTETLWPALRGRILTREKAWARSWDAVMIPGAGAPAEWFERIARLQDPRFGVRVQHILNDPSRRENFLQVNASLKPDVVITNNSQWTTADYHGFEGDAFFVEPGAVDLNIHRPLPGKPI